MFSTRGGFPADLRQKMTPFAPAYMRNNARNRAEFRPLYGVCFDVVIYNAETDKPFRTDKFTQR
jgi:hypothetical protein